MGRKRPRCRHRAVRAPQDKRAGEGFWEKRATHQGLIYPSKQRRALLKITDSEWALKSESEPHSGFHASES